MPKVVVNEGTPEAVKLHYQQVGQGEDLVLIHGLTGNLAIWHLQMAPMLYDKYRLMTYDLRGHGYSEITPSHYTLDQMADDLLALLDAKGIDKVSLAGHSYGADTALYFAHRYPERTKSVIVIEAALPALIYQRASDDWAGWDYWVDVLEKSGREVPPERRTDMVWLLRESLEVPKKWGPMQGLPRNPKPFLKLLEETTMPEDSMEIGSFTVDAIAELQAPVTLICCENSAFIGTHDYLAEHLPNSRSVLLPRTDWGHFGPLEQPELVAKEILIALEGVA
jgi:pimeloyl-ACP methyl ester carboxylesterase